jgi:MFS family permease
VLEISLLMLAFFTGFNLLEATLPSLIAKMAPPDAKGTAMGVYSSSQFLGAFAGGALGGLLHGRVGLQGVFAFATLGALAWLLVAWTMRNPSYLSSYLLNVGALDEGQAWDLAARLTQVPRGGGGGGHRRRRGGLSQGGPARAGRSGAASLCGDGTLSDAYVSRQSMA